MITTTNYFTADHSISLLKAFSIDLNFLRTRGWCYPHWYMVVISDRFCRIVLTSNYFKQLNSTSCLLMVSSSRIKLIFLSDQFLWVIIRRDNCSPRHHTTSKSYALWRAVWSTPLCILTNINSHARPQAKRAKYWAGSSSPVLHFPWSSSVTNTWSVFIYWGRTHLH